MNKPPEIPEHLKSLLKQLNGYPILIVQPSKRNKVNILQVIQNLPTMITKSIMTNLDRKTGEDLVVHHNYKTIKKQ